MLDILKDKNFLIRMGISVLLFLALIPLADVPSSDETTVFEEVSTEGELIELTSKGSDYGPRVSPDGNKIVYYSNREGNYDIYIMNPDGSGVKQLTDNASNEVDPDFHPTENSIVYASDETGSYEIYSLNLESGMKTQLTHNTPYDARHPRISPIKWRGIRDTVEGWDWDNPGYQYYNILYEGVFSNRSELFIVCDFGSKERQITRTPDGEVIHEIPEYYEPEIGYEKVSSSTFTNPEWFGGGLNIISIGEISGDNHLITLLSGWSYWEPTRREEMTDVLSVTPSRNQTQLLLLKSDGSLSIHTVKTGEEHNIGRIEGEFTPMGWAPDGKAIVYSSNGNIYLQRLKNPLSEIANLWLYDYFTTDQMDALAKNGFVVTDRFKKNIVDHYHPPNRPGGERYKKPYFITTDVTLHLFYLFYDYLLVEMETSRMLPLVKRMVFRALDLLMKDIEDASGEERQTLVFLRDYFLVAGGLIDPFFREGDYPDRVVNEWENIDAKKGSSMMFPYSQPVKLDYSQFKVRGHYDVSEELRRYFRTVMWFGQGKLPLNKSYQNLQEMRRSLFFIKLMKDEELNELYGDFYDVVSVLFGPPESVTLQSLGEISEEVFGPNPTYSELTDEGKIREVFERMKEEIDRPRIFPAQGYTFKLLPQVFATDTYILQQLVFEKVGTMEEPRLLPKGLDLMCAFGSANAKEYLLELYDEDRYVNYEKQLEAVEKFVRGLDEGWGMETIYSGWMETLTSSFIGENDQKYPDFMRTSAWEDKSLMTALSSWTELRHTAILYVAQTGAWGGGGGPPEYPVIPPPKGYVEPNDEYYDKMLALLGMVERVFTERDMWYETTEHYDEPLEKRWFENPAEVFQILYAIIEKLGVISDKELKGEQITDDEYAFINGVGFLFDDIAGECMSSASPTGGDTSEGMSMALVVDVATGISAEGDLLVLHEAIGNSPEIACIYPVDGLLQIAKGGTFSYYEFIEEGKRLSDEDWKGMLMGGEYYSSQSLVDYGTDDMTYEEQEEYREKLAEEAQEKFMSSEAPQMPEWTKSFYCPTTFTVIAEEVELRDGPRTKETYGESAGEVIAVVHKGDRLSFLGEEEYSSDRDYHWYLVMTEEGEKGWVCHKKIISDNGIIIGEEVYLK